MWKIQNKLYCAWSVHMEPKLLQKVDKVPVQAVYLGVKNFSRVIWRSSFKQVKMDVKSEFCFQLHECPV